jgi:hypothetical protein
VEDDLVTAAETLLPTRVLVAGAAVGVVASLAVPSHPLGAGLPVLVVAAVASVTTRIPRARRVEAGGFAALSIALAATTLLRSAPWVIAFNLALSFGLASVAVSGGKTWKALLEGVTGLLRRLPASTHLVFLSTGCRLGREKLRRVSPIARGLALGAVLLVPFAALFATADQAFARLASDVVVPDWNLGLLPARLLTFGLATLFVSTLAVVASEPRGFTARTWRNPRQAAPHRKDSRALGALEWGIAIGILDLLFAGFVLVQVAVLFGGRDRVLRTSGLTYAEYARSGFVQLMVAATLTLTVVGFVSWRSGKTKMQTRVLRALLGSLCCLTIIILISAIRRLGLYEEAFGFTHARLLAHIVMLWLGGIFALVVTGGMTKTSWLPRAVVVWTAVITIVSSTVVNPDGLIAARNVDRYRQTGELDVRYVSTLSADAVPALAQLPPDIRVCALGPIAARLSDDESLAGWNLGRDKARDILATLDDAVGRFCVE